MALESLQNMVGITLTKRRRLMGPLACLLLLQVHGVWAGLITTEAAVANFRFTGTTLSVFPSLPDDAVLLTIDQTVVFTIPHGKESTLSHSLPQIIL